MSEQELNSVVDQIMADYDTNNSGDLDKAEAKKFSIDLFNALGKDTTQLEANYDEKFKEFDKNGNGVICKDELKSFLIQLAEQFS